MVGQVVRRLVIMIAFIALGVNLFGQQFQFREAQKLPIGINSNAEESRPIISWHDQRLYFTRLFSPLNQGGKYGGGDVWYYDLNDSINFRSYPMNAWNTLESDELIGVNMDSDTYYLRNPKRPDRGILFVRKVNDEFLKPELIPIKGLSMQGFIDFYMHPSYEVLLVSMEAKESLGDQDLFVVLKDSTNRWSNPMHLGNTLNTEGFEITPFLSLDKKYIFFASNGHGGFGDSDIFFSKRLYDNWAVWSKPRNLGPEINSPAFDAFFSVYNDSLCYFTSNRVGKFMDIYSSVLSVSKTNILQDSIDKIVYEAEQLLINLENTKNLIDKEYVIFEKGVAELSTKAQKVIKKVIFNDERKYFLIAHSNDFFDGSLNNELSENRAQSVRSYLIGEGVDPSFITYRLSRSTDELSSNKSGVLINVMK